MGLKLNECEVEDTFCETFESTYVRFEIIGDSEEIVRNVANKMSHRPAVVVGETEGSMEYHPRKLDDGLFHTHVQIGGLPIKTFASEVAHRVAEGIRDFPSIKIMDAPITESNEKIKFLDELIKLPNVDKDPESYRTMYTDLLITCENEKELDRSILALTSLSGLEHDRTEGILMGKGTDNIHRDYWAKVRIYSTYKDEKSLNKFSNGLLDIDIRQNILVFNTTKVFDATENPDRIIDTLPTIGHCADIFYTFEKYGGREVIRVPIMNGCDFMISPQLGVKIDQDPPPEPVSVNTIDYEFPKTLTICNGVSANVWYMCDERNAIFNAGEKIIDAMFEMVGVTIPFYICSAGSKPASDNIIIDKKIGPTTNHQYCPTLKGKFFNGIKVDSKVPDGIYHIPEVVINATTKEKAVEAMAKCMDIASKVDGVKIASAGNYGGRLSKGRIELKDVVEKLTNYSCCL
jgi:formylmethanofuran--tetrahydromethanopterin N-formyltransferase